MNDDKTMQISLLCHKLEGLKKERRYMEYEINGKPEVKVRRKAYEAKKAEAQKRRNEKVDRATMYAAEMERRVESLERNDRKQKEKFEKFKELLRVLEVVRQENGIQVRAAILNELKNGLNQDENQSPAQNRELKVALEYAAEMEKRVEGLDSVIRNQERMFQELAENMEKVRKANVALRRKNARLEAELKAAAGNQDEKENQ